jgi:tRNA G37 N-methylase TrmD
VFEIIFNQRNLNDYVLSGELGALVLSDALIRLIPGVLAMKPQP